MKLSTNWLKELCPVEADAAEIARRLTAAGLEVEGSSVIGNFAGVIVAEVRATQKHPKADKLTLVDVWDGRDVTQVVCGAPNVPAAGGRVAWAKPGAKLPDGRTMEAREVRGVLSPGMLCAEDELGLGASHEGIVHLDASFEAGADLSSLLGFPDTILELNVTPNRPDCLGHLGVARELAALFGAKLSSLTPRVLPRTSEDGDAITSLSSVALIDAQGCPRYLARVLDQVRVAQSPLRVRLRLQALGIRAINNVVDATNLTLLETGHPLHAFDLDKLAGHRIVVRRARGGEPIRTLDGQERSLTAEDVAICDAERPVAVAGIMGGGDSEVSASTTRILLESAYFSPARIRRTARRLGLSTEASQRFERGADPNQGVSLSSLRCAELIANLAGARVARGEIDAYPSPITPLTIRLRPARTDQIIGLDIAATSQAARLSSIGIETSIVDGEIVSRVPTFRPDLTREIDLVEEIARLVGYDAVPSTIPKLSPAISQAGRRRADARPEAARSVLVAVGFSEAVTYAFVGPDRIAALSFPEHDPRTKPLRIRNPLREEQSALRTSLLPGLLGALSRNLAHGTSDQRLFEVGTIFLRSQTPRPKLVPLSPLGRDELLPEERTHVAGVLVGRREGWLKPGDELDFFDVKGVVEALLAGLWLRAPSLSMRAPGEHERAWLHPGISAVVTVGDAEVGAFGEVHPDVRPRFGIEQRAFAFELDLARLGAPGPVAATDLPRYPGSARDLSFFVDRGVPSAALVSSMRSASGLIEAVRPLEDYREPGKVPEGKKGMLYSISYRARDRTLTDEEITREQGLVLAALKAGFAIEQR